MDTIVSHRPAVFKMPWPAAYPKPTKGFWQALQDLQIDRAYVIAPVMRRYPLAEGVDVVPVKEVRALLED